MSDADLALASLRGDREAFAALVERHARMVAGVAFAATGDGALVDDVVQDTFVAAWQRLATLRDPELVRPWLRRIAQNLARKAWRRRRREMPAVELGADATPFDAIADRERTRVVAAAIARLPARYREPLVLFYFEQQSVREVASALHLREAAVMQRLARARKQLGDALAGEVTSDLSRRGAAPMVGVAGAVLALIGASHVAAAATPTTTVGSHATRTAVRVAAALGVLAAGAWLAERAVSTSHAEKSIESTPLEPTPLEPTPLEPTPLEPHRSAPSPAPALPRATTPAEAPAIPPAHDGSGDGSGMHWASQPIRNMVVAVDDPVETCRRATVGLAVAALSGPNRPQGRAPSERIMDRAYEIAEQTSQSCAGGVPWPTLWAICEASPIDVLDGKVNCYPFDEFD